MIQKLALEQFREIKNSMLRIIELVDNSEDLNEIDVERFLKEYNSLLDKLLSSNLSDIPFEEWQGLYIFIEGELDLSKTHANIDFSLLEGIEYDSIKLDGCNVRKIQVLHYDETTFNADFMKTHPKYFPDESIPVEVRKLFYNRRFTIEDFNDNPELLNIFGNTNIACAFLEEMSWIISLFNELADFKEANYNRMKVITAYSKIHDGELKVILI